MGRFAEGLRMVQYSEVLLFITVAREYGTVANPPLQICMNYLAHWLVFTTIKFQNILTEARYGPG
jgi:hypothetical protein